MVCVCVFEIVSKESNSTCKRDLLFGEAICWHLSSVESSSARPRMRVTVLPAGVSRLDIPKAGGGDLEGGEPKLMRGLRALS